MQAIRAIEPRRRGRRGGHLYSMAARGAPRHAYRATKLPARAQYHRSEIGHVNVVGGRLVPNRAVLHHKVDGAPTGQGCIGVTKLKSRVRNLMRKVRRDSFSDGQMAHTGGIRVAPTWAYRLILVDRI